MIATEANVIERVFAYCDDIMSGRIKACKKHMWAVERFLRDYEDCQTNDDSPFYFDKEEGEDFYWWAREFQHVEGVLAGQAVELTDFQLFIAVNIFCFIRKSATEHVVFEKCISSSVERMRNLNSWRLLVRTSYFLAKKSNVYTSLDGKKTNRMKYMSP